VIVSDKKNVHAKPKIPGLAVNSPTSGSAAPTATTATTAAPATGGSVTARAVLQHPRSAEKPEEPALKRPNLSSSGRSDAEVDFFGMLNEEPPTGFRAGPGTGVREELLEVAEFSFSEVLKFGPPSAENEKKVDPTTVKGKTAKLEKLFPQGSVPTRQPHGSPLKKAAPDPANSGTSSTLPDRGRKNLPAMPPLPDPSKGSQRPRSGSQPVQPISDWTNSPQAPGTSGPTKITAARFNYSAPRVTTATTTYALTPGDQSGLSPAMSTMADPSIKITADAERQPLPNIARPAHLTTSSTSAKLNPSTSHALSNVTRISDPGVCFENPAIPGCKFPSIVVYSGSWFVTTQRYGQIGSRLGKSDNVLPAYESFIPGAPAEVTGDGKWSEVMVHFQRCAEVVGGAGKTSLHGSSANEIFRGNPAILWNGKEILLYEPMSRFVNERLGASRFFDYVRVVLAAIEGECEDTREKLAGDIAESFCSDFLLDKMPRDLVSELISLDQAVMSWALDSAASPGEIAAVRRDVAIVFLVTKGTIALMTQGDGKATGATSARSGGSVMQFGGLVAKAMKEVMRFPNSGTALSERIMKKSLEQMISGSSIFPDWKARLEKLQDYEDEQRSGRSTSGSQDPGKSNVAGTATTASSSTTSTTTATTASSSTTSTTADRESGSKSKSQSNPRSAIRRAGTAGKLTMPDDTGSGARAEKKRLLKELYATPWYSKKPEKMQKAIRGALRRLDADTLDAKIVRERAEKCVADYQEKKRLIKAIGKAAWFKELPAETGAAVLDRLNDVDADGLTAGRLEKTARKCAADYRLKTRLLAKFYENPQFREMPEELKKAIRIGVEEVNTDDLTEGKFMKEVEKIVARLGQEWGRKTPQSSPEKSKDGTELSPSQSASGNADETEPASHLSPSDQEKKKRS
jgi:hypothetical protein